MGFAVIILTTSGLSMLIIIAPMLTPKVSVPELFIVIFGSLFVSVGLFGIITEAIKQAKKEIDKKI